MGFFDGLLGARVSDFDAGNAATNAIELTKRNQRVSLTRQGAATGHSHATPDASPRFSLLTAFFAGTSGILLILLLAQSLRTRRASSQPGPPHA